MLYNCIQYNPIFTSIIFYFCQNALMHEYGHFQKKKVAFCDIVKIKKSQIFVLFENEISYEDLCRLFVTF